MHAALIARASIVAAAAAVAPAFLSSAAAAPPRPTVRPSFSWGLQAGLWGKTQLPGGHFTYALRAGSRLSDDVTVYNLGPRPQTVRMYGADLVNARGGGFAPAQAYDPRRVVGAWVHLRRNQLTVPPHAHLSNPFTIRIPFGTPPGDYYGAVVGATVPGHSTSGVRVQTRIGLIVHAIVPGAVHLRVAVGPLSASRHGDSEQFGVALHNHGNVTFTFSGEIVVHHGGATTLIRLAPADIYVVPGGYALLHGLWNGLPLIGSASAHARIHVRVNNKAYGTYSGQALTLTFFPWTEVALGCGALVALIGIVLLLRPRLRRWLQRRRDERALLTEFRARRRAQACGDTSDWEAS